MIMFKTFNWTVLLTLKFIYLSSAQIHKLKGSTVVFTCQFNDTNGNGMTWSFGSSTSGPWTTYTANTDIANVPAKPRISITGDTAGGEYKLNIRDLQKSDTGYYQCNLGNGVNIGDPQQLTVIVGPTSVQITGMTSDNKLEGTEGLSLQIKCDATGGSPPPDVKLLIAGSEISVGKQSVTYTIPTLNRSHDRQSVQCLAGNTAINDFPLTDSAELQLKLKPLVPNLNLNLVSVKEGQMLVIKCSSSGSRPAAGLLWEINGVDITSSSQITSTVESSNNTYTVMSQLTYTLTKDQNGQELICKAINPAAPGGVPAVPITVDVRYPPTVTVDSKTVTDDISPVVLTCNTDANPEITTNYEWTHETLQGTVIRSLNSETSILTLPGVNSSLQYQNTGRYNCTVGNGIPDTATRRTGAGVLTVNAPPVFALYNKLTQGGEKGKPASISIDVYSVPSLTTVQWYRGNTLVSGSGYIPSSSPTAVRVMFHGKEMEVDGFRVTLSINDVTKSDFNTYRLVVSNNRGSQEQNIVFKSISPPDAPTNLTVIDETDTSLTVQWSAGYDGGYEQTFFMVYRQQGTDTWTTVTAPKEVRGSSDEVHQFVISGLKHSTTYEIKMFAENHINKSAVTDVLIGVTETTVEGGSTGAIIGGVAGSLTGVVIILVVVLVVMKFRNRQDGCKKSLTNKLRQKGGSESESEDGLKENILYDTSGNETINSSGPVYAEVVKNNHNAANTNQDVYSEVKKTPKKMNKAPKGKAKTRDKGKKIVSNNNADSEYANSDLPLKRLSNGEYANNEDVQGISGRQKNADGLEYADLAFAKQPTTGKPVIHGEERTIYSDIDHFKVGNKPPQEGAYEDTTIGEIKLQKK